MNEKVRYILKYLIDICEGGTPASPLVSYSCHNNQLVLTIEGFGNYITEACFVNVKELIREEKGELLYSQGKIKVTIPECS